MTNNVTLCAFQMRALTHDEIEGKFSLLFFSFSAKPVNLLHRSGFHTLRSHFVFCVLCLCPQSCVKPSLSLTKTRTASSPAKTWATWWGPWVTCQLKWSWSNWARTSTWTVSGISSSLSDYFLCVTLIGVSSPFCDSLVTWIPFQYSRFFKKPLWAKVFSVFLKGKHASCSSEAHHAKLHLWLLKQRDGLIPMSEAALVI